MLNAPRFARPELLTAFPLLSSIMGGTIAALLYLSFTNIVASLKLKPKGAITLRRKRGRIVAADQAEDHYIVKSNALKHERSFTSLKEGEVELKGNEDVERKRANCMFVDYWICNVEIDDIPLEVCQLCIEARRTALLIKARA